MKRLVLAFAMLWMATNMLATKYALIIGVGKYAPNTGWSATSAINDVKLLKPSLEKAGFVVTTLVDSQATHEGITIALNRLIRKVKAGDQVYLHFSGHGQQLKNPRSNEPDKLDEAMVPYDAGLYYSKTNYGQKHLRDKELNLYITRLRTKLKKHGMLLVALDACHSGDATRGNSGPDKDEPDFVGNTRGSTHVLDGGTRLPQFTTMVSKTGSSPYIALGACKDYETNKDYRSKGGKHYGSLSFLIWQELEQKGKSINLKTLPYDVIKKKHQTMSHRQHPDIKKEGM